MGATGPMLDMYGNDPGDTFVYGPPIAAWVDWRDDAYGVRTLTILFAPHHMCKSCMHQIDDADVYFDIRSDEESLWLGKIVVPVDEFGPSLTLKALMGDRAYGQLAENWQRICNDPVHVPRDTYDPYPMVIGVDRDERSEVRRVWKQLHWRLHDKRPPGLIRSAVRYLRGKSRHPVS